MSLQDILATGPAAAGRWRGLKVVAVDGTLLPVLDCPANLAVFTRQRIGRGISGYPQLRLAALVACWTRSAIGAAFGPATTGEMAHRRRKLPRGTVAVRLCDAVPHSAHPRRRRFPPHRACHGPSCTDLDHSG